MKKSKVYWTAVKQSDDIGRISSKLAGLVEASRALDCVRPKDKVALKIHFGEEGNQGFVRPEYVRVIHDFLVEKDAEAFLADTNTLYRGRRMNSAGHLRLAYEHGFTPDVVAAPVVIPDEAKAQDTTSVEIKQRFIKVAKIARVFHQADVILGLNHFKGHMMTGFGGALKNIGMGCATREGKMAQHSDIAPLVNSGDCIGCAACVEACPVQAISMKKQKAYLEDARCIGCASCIAACNSEAIDLNWEQGGGVIQEKMVEYAYATLKDKQEKCAFFNFLIKITKECDCLAKDDPRIAPDIGMLASLDPVSIDQASLDLVTQACGRDIFKKVHPDRDGSKQLQYAFKLGLGNLDYQLIEVMR